MNQAASATRRSPAGSTATPGCCPMFSAPFFVNTFAPQAPLLPPPPAQPCFLGSQTSQHAQIPNTNQRSQQQPSYPVVAQQQPPPPTPVQQLGQATRNILSDVTLNNLFNDQFQAILLNQLFSSQQFAPPSLPPQTQQLQERDVTLNTQTLVATRPPTLPSNGQVSVVMPPAQQTAPQATSLQPSEPVSDNQRSSQQNRISPVVPDSTNSPLGLFQPQHQNVPTDQQQTTQSSLPLPTQQTTVPLQGAQSHSAPQPQSTLPPIPFYAYPHMEQAIALLTNPQVANNIFHHVFNIYLQSGLRSEPHHTHHHHSAPHHFHHHMHAAQHHHHHHHGPAGHINGQDGTMPMDAMAANEAKPRGLNRAEIDSLTPYIHMNEKDSRTCVICLSKFELKSKIRPLPCNHAFHAKCVDKWLRTNRTCPICRRDALRTYNAKIKRI